MDDEKIESGWYLFTNNFIIGHKKFYKSRLDALKDLDELVNKSEKIYKEELKENASKEHKENIKILKKRDLTNNHGLELSHKAESKYRNFNGFSENELEVSIHLLQLNIKKSHRELVYKEKRGI